MFVKFSKIPARIPKLEMRRLKAATKRYNIVSMSTTFPYHPSAVSMVIGHQFCPSTN